MAPQEKTAQRDFSERKKERFTETQIRITRSKAKIDTTETDSRTSLRSVAHLLFLLKQILGRLCFRSVRLGAA